MLDVTGWRPYDPWSNSVREALDHLINEPRAQRGPVPMALNAFEDGDALVVEASMPGVRPEDVELSCVDQVLTIRGRAHVARREYLHQELQDVEFLRRLTLPADCRFEQAQASAEHGLVAIRIPKERPRAPEKIRIQVTRRNTG
jgi:HSP20 family protein